MLYTCVPLQRRRRLATFMHFLAAARPLNGAGTITITCWEIKPDRVSSIVVGRVASPNALFLTTTAIARMETRFLSSLSSLTIAQKTTLAKGM